MFILWNWLATHQNLVEAFLGGVAAIGIPSWLTLRGQRQAMRLATEGNRLALKEQRKQFCVAFLISIHEVAPLIAELRNAHDNLWARQKLFFRAHSYVKQVNAILKHSRKKPLWLGANYQ